MLKFYLKINGALLDLVLFVWTKGKGTGKRGLLTMEMGTIVGKGGTATVG